jgi:uncharacterized membrane protein
MSAVHRIVPAGRIVGLDVARCLALVGMIATHTLLPATPDGDVTVIQSIAGGRASALFAVLAGVSLALMSGRQHPPGGRDLAGAAAGLAVRALLIAVIGLLLGGLEHGVAVILTYYGVLFLLGIPFLPLRAPALAALAAAWAVAAPVLSHVVRPSLPRRGFASPSVEMLDQPLSLLSELTFTGYYPAVPWMTYLLAGMAIGRLDLRRPRTAVWLLCTGVVAAVLAKAVSAALLARPGVLPLLERTFSGPASTETFDATLAHGLYGVTPTGTWWWLAVASPHSGTPLDLAHTAGCALAVIGACLLLSRFAGDVWAVVFGAGAMTLTLYSLHLVVRALAPLPDDTMATFYTHVVMVLVIGAGYRLARRSGPVERVVAMAANATRRAVSGDPQLEGSAK